MRVPQTRPRRAGFFDRRRERGEENLSLDRGALIKAIVAVLFWTLVVVAATGCESSSEQQAVAEEITSLKTSNGAVQTGSPAEATVRIKNTSAEDHTLWIGYSVQDSAGKWHDAPAVPVKLAAGEESGTQQLSTEPLETPGYYKTRVSVWSEKPEDEKTGEDKDDNSGNEAQRLADSQEASAFRIFSIREDFDSRELDSDRWEATSQDLGRGELAPENVTVEDGQLRLSLPANTLNGSEIESKEDYGLGFYAARIKVPDAPSSITGFFLYNPPDLESEIDIEIYNDSSRKIMFTTYAGGKQTHTETMELPFNPTEDFHDYAFFYDQNSVTFYVDGEPMKEFEGGLPSKQMKLHVNAWFPKWLDGEEPDSERFVYVDWIER